MYAGSRDSYGAFMSIRFTPIFIFIALLAAACGSDDQVGFEDVPPGEATLVDEAEFIEIAPFARFASAQGDFMAGEHGTFGIFGAGAASPPHTHSGAYYAVVIDGQMNNPFGTEADPPSLPPGSFWSVPADDEHVTACLTPDRECTFFFHAAGAFDFFPLEEMTQARTTDAVAVPVGDLAFRALDPYDAAATVWGDPDSGPHGTMIRIEAGADTGGLAHRNAFSLVPATGSVTIETGGTATALPIGRLLEAAPNTVHSLSCDDDADCVLYLFSDAPLDIAT